MEFKTHNHVSVDLDQVGMVGYMTATQKDLTKVFGKPMNRGIDERTTFEWAVVFADYTVACIYDYRAAHTPTWDEPFQWHVGAHNQRGLKLVHDALREGLALHARSAA